MQKQHGRKNLILRHEQLRRLSPAQLGNAAGGVVKLPDDDSVFPFCATAPTWKFC